MCRSVRNAQGTRIHLKPSLCAGNGVKKMYVGQYGFMATPAMSAVIRRRKLYGGFIMSASHNPAGPKEDWGIKFNYSSGEPAPEKITNEIFKYTESIKELKWADIPDVDLTKIGVTKFGDFEVEVIDFAKDYLELLQEVRLTLLLPLSLPSEYLNWTHGCECILKPLDPSACKGALLPGCFEAEPCSCSQQDCNQTRWCRSLTLQR
jgi:hypothetical protein